MIDQGLVNKFWKDVDKSQGPDGHWFRIFRIGYQHTELYIHGAPTVTLGNSAKGGHRWAYILTYGNIPHGLIVRHRCGWGGCCNPLHLCLGSGEENAWDRWARLHVGAQPDDLCTYEDVPDWIPPRMR